MDESPVFFIPDVARENQETIYAYFAKKYDLPIPNLSERIYSIVFIHNSEEWTATVGEKLQGIRRKSSQSKGRKIVQTQELVDQAIVLAIFPGKPFQVFTNSGVVENIRSNWANPFMADPKSKRLFSVK